MMLYQDSLFLYILYCKSSYSRTVDITHDLCKGLAKMVVGESQFGNVFTAHDIVSEACLRPVELEAKYLYQDLLTLTLSSISLPIGSPQLSLLKSQDFSPRSHYFLIALWGLVFYCQQCPGPTHIFCTISMTSILSCHHNDWQYVKGI
jgi:hypothetical protein